MDGERNDKKPLPLKYPLAESLCSEVLSRFMRRHVMIFDFFFFAVDLVTRVDKQRLIVVRALAINGTDKDQENLREAEANPNLLLNKLSRFGDYNSEIMCIRVVDNFLTFISELIQSCMLKRPELLKSSEMVKIEDVLKHTKRSEIVRYLIDRKINELGYGGIEGIGSFLQSRTGITLTETQEERDLLVLSIELRNIYTHSRGRVNETFMRRIKGIKRISPAPGKRLHADYDLIVDMANNLFELAARLDQKIAKKFRVKRKRYDAWTGDKKTPGRTSAGQISEVLTS